MKLIDFYPKRFGSILALVLVFMLGAASADAAVTVTLDRADGMYALGAPATFTLTSDSAGSYSVVFRRDGLITTETTTLYLSGTPVILKKTLYKPGWLMIRVGGTDKIGAIWDPYHLQSGKGCPADFDEFWQNEKRKIAVDYTPEIAFDSTRSNAYGTYDVWHVKIPMPEGRPVQGYMSKPRGVAAHSIPAVAFTHGSGVRTSNIPVAWIASGTVPIIGFDFNAHGIDDGQAASYYTALDTGELKYYRTEGWESRDTVYFRLMYMRALRAMDFLTRQPEWDGKTLACLGNSQGGAQAIVVGALEPRVSVVVAGAPALSDLNAWVNNRIDGWPHTVGTALPVNAAISNTALYYDTNNFARRVQGDFFMTTGLIDTTCCPVTVLPNYNNLASIPGRRAQVMIMPAVNHSYALYDSTYTKPRTQGENFIKQYFLSPRKAAAMMLNYE